MGAEFKRLFADAPINKILPSRHLASELLAWLLVISTTPLWYSRKRPSPLTFDGEMYRTRIQSFTHGKVFDVIVSKKFIGPDDHALIIDDFL